MLTTSMATMAALQVAPHQPITFSSRTAHVRMNEIPYDIKFLREAKTALRNAVDAQGGLLDEDALACVEALTAVNPSLPNPSEDNDLWSGKFSFCTALFGGALGCRGTVVLEESGALEVQCKLALAGTGDDATATLHVSGDVAADGDTSLALQEGSKLALQGAGPEIVAACAAAFPGLKLEVADDGGFLAAPPSLTLSQLYLDQDMHIVSVADAAPLVLCKEK